MNTVSEIIENLGGAAKIAFALKIPSTTVGSWKARDGIPFEYWARLAEISNGSISVDVLAKVRRPRKRRAA